MRERSRGRIGVSVCWRACTRLFLLLQDCERALAFFTCVSVCMGFWAQVCACMFTLSPWQVCVRVPECCAAFLSITQPLVIMKWWWGVRPHLIKEKIPSPINLINPTPEKDKQKETCLCVCVCLCEICGVSKLNSRIGLSNAPCVGGLNDITCTGTVMTLWRNFAE